MDGIHPHPRLLGYDVIVQITMSVEPSAIRRNYLLHPAHRLERMADDYVTNRDPGDEQQDAA